MEIIVITALTGYAIYRAAQFRRYKKYRIMPRVQVQELAARLASDQADRVQIVDVRSHGYYDIGAERIAGSIRIDPTILRRRSSISQKRRTFTSTVLEHAKRLAPGWRIYCKKKASTRS